MNFTSQQVEEQLKLAGFEYALSSIEIERLCYFLDLRAKWSHTHNLSGPQALSTVWTDVIDVCAIALVIDAQLPIIDVGSGSGVPGLMLACLKPQQKIYLIEPSAKRCAFLKTAIYQLKLDQVQVHRGRWPWTSGPDEAYQIMSRAVVDPKKWPLWAQHAQVAEIIQMLAAERPAWPIEHSHLQSQIEYLSPLGGQRLIRRWQLSKAQVKA